MKKINIGAPSLSKDDVASHIKKLFGSAEFPRKISVKNGLFRDISLPEIKTYLTAEEEKTVVVADVDALYRVVSSIQQIAELDRKEVVIVLTDAESEPAQEETPPEPPQTPNKTKV